MKPILLIILCCAVGIGVVNTSSAQQATTIVESTSHNVFTGLFRSVWARLKSLSPTQKESARSASVYTAGIRGAESTDTLLKPYWKDDLTQDEAFQAELQKFSLAQIKMDSGELEAAIADFDIFLNQYSTSALRPNALFGKSLCLAGLGQVAASKSAMQLFIDENPNHPLIDDANSVITELGQ